MPQYSIEIRLPVLWGDMDSLGHVNNARYFTWLEAARIELFRKVGVFAQEGVGPVLRATSCEYLRSVVYPSDVVIRTRVIRIGRSSIQMEYEIALATAPTEVVARAQSTAVIVDFSKNEPVEVSSAIRDAIDALQSA